MAQMNASMKLTLADLATPELRKFGAQLEAISAKVASLNAEFSTFGEATKKFNAGIGNSSRSLGSLDGRIGTLLGSLSALSTRMTESIGKMEGFAASTINAGTGARTAAADINNAGQSINLMAGSADKARHSIMGLVEAYGALKIAKGLGAAVKSEADLQTQQAALRVAGISPQAVKYATDQSYKMSTSIGLVSQNEALDARRKLIAALGQNKELQIDKALPELLRNAYIVKALYQKSSSIGDIAGSFAGGAEILGRANSAQGLVSTSNVLLKAQGGSQGRMTQADIETVLRQNKYNPMLNDKSVLWLMAFAEQMKNLGGGGGGGGHGVSMAGTGFSMLSGTIMNPKMSKQTAAMYSRIGMFSQKGMQDLKTSTTGTVAGSELLGASTAIQDMPGWIENVLAPHVIAYVKAHPKRYGLSANMTPQELDGAITKAVISIFKSTGGVNVASTVLAGALPEKAAMIRSHQNMMEQTKVGKEGVADLAPLTTAWSNVTTAATNFGNQLGAVLYPALTKILDVVASVISSINALVKSTPMAAEGITAIATAIAGLLGLRAAAWFMRMIGLMGSIGAASTTAAASVATGSAAMLAVWRARLMAMGALALRFVSIIGVAFLLKEAADNIKIGGVAISGHIAALIFGLFSQFDKFFGWLSGKFADAWDWGTKLANQATGKTGFMANAARALGVNNYTTPDGKGVSNDLVNPFRKAQASFRGAQSDWNAAGVDAMTPHASGGAYKPSDGPDALASFEHAMNARADQAVLGPDTPIGALNKTGRRSAVSAYARQQNQAMQRALDFLRNMQATNDPIQQIKNRFQPNIMALSSGGRVDLAAQTEDLMNQQIADETKKLQQKKLESLKKALSDLQAESDGKSKVTAALVTTGALTPDQGQAQTLKDQKAAAPGLIAAAQAVRDYEKAMGESTTTIDATIIKLRAMGDGLTALQTQIKNTVQGAFSSFFDELMGGKTSWKDMGKKFVENIVNGINSAVSKDLSSQLVEAMFGSKTGAGGLLRSVGGSGGAMTSIGSWIGNLFGGGSTASSGTASTGSSIFGKIGSLFSGIIGSFAVGADNIPNDMVAQIHKGEMIIPAAGADAIRSGKLSGQGHTINLSVNAMDSQSVLGAMDGIKRELADMLHGASYNLNMAR